MTFLDSRNCQSRKQKSLELVGNKAENKNEERALTMASYVDEDGTMALSRY